MSRARVGLNLYGVLESENVTRGPGADALGPLACPEVSMATGWKGSDRRQRLPPNWPTIREDVKRRARGMCEARPHAPGCSRRGSDADHITPGDDHSMANLQWLSGPCHAAKTARESAQRNTQRATMRKRTETHPGEIR